MRTALTSASSAVERDSGSNIRRVRQLNEFLLDFVSLLWQKRFLQDDPAPGPPAPAPRLRFGMTA